jgi:hypothetical protein
MSFLAKNLTLKKLPIFSGFLVFNFYQILDFSINFNFTNSKNFNPPNLTKNSLPDVFETQQF